MADEMTARMQAIFAQQILSPEAVHGDLRYSTTIAGHNQDRYLLLAFADGRWACYQARREGKHDGWQHQYQLSVELVIPAHYFWGLDPLMTSLHEAGVISDDIWEEQQAFEHHQRTAMLDAERRARETRQAAREVHQEQTRQQKREAAFEHALRLAYGHEATDPGLRQMRAAEQRRVARCALDTTGDARGG